MLNECKIFPKGNLLKWEKVDFKLQNLNFKNVENLTNFHNKNEFYIIPEKVELAQASAHCKSFEDQVASPSDEEENVWMIQILQRGMELSKKQKANSRKWNQVVKENKCILFNSIKMNIV